MFVPSRSLKARTLYTVTLKRGIALPGTGQRLLRDVTMRFETRGRGLGTSRLVLPDRWTDAARRERPTITVDFYRDDEGPRTIPRTVPVTVHRFARMNAALAAYERLAVAPDWASTGGAPISTSGLQRVLTARPAVHHVTDPNDDVAVDPYLQLPTTLPAGWYLLTLTHAGLRQQAIIQVTDLSAYADVSETQTVVWVNSVRTGRAVRGATIRLDGHALGRTNRQGLRLATTPDAVVTAARASGVPLFLVATDPDGRRVAVPVSHPGCFKCYEDVRSPSDHDAWWHALALDQRVLRSTDTANAWGVVRSRDDGTVPSSVEVRLQAWDDWMEAQVPIVSTTATPSRAGMFRADLAFEDVPAGEYQIAMLVDGRVIGSTWLTIAPIVKPAYRLAVSTDRHAVVAGETVTVRAEASFFDGTHVPGVDLAVSTSEDGDDVEHGMRTDPDGVGTTPLPLMFPSDDGQQWEWRTVTAGPSRPEEADISGSTSVAVFRSTALLTTEARLQGRRLTVSGAVHDVDFAGMEAVDPGTWEADPTGDPRSGARVRLKVIEVTPVRRRIGTSYDFITKQSAPVYAYEDRERTVATETAVTARNGTYRWTGEVRAGEHQYRIEATYREGQDRSIRADAYAWSASALDGQMRPSLVQTSGSSETDERAYRVGDDVALSMVGGHPDPSDDRYLFTVSHRGLRSATTQAGPDFVAEFDADWVPNAFVDGVRFTGRAYEIADTRYLGFDTDSRRLDVDVQADADRYAPGDRVTLTVRVRDAGGRPVRASVAVRVIDEKLYAAYAADEIDLLSGLYGSVSDGELARGASHEPPRNRFEGGDTGGGGGDDGERDDFRDRLIVRIIETGADGLATVAFDLSDDLTSWRASATAVDEALRVGDARADLPVSRPFFAEAVLAGEYLAGDQPVLRVRAYGSGLAAADDVRFTVTSTTIELDAAATSARAFRAASVRLPALTVGDHRLRIEATATTADGPQRDVLIRTIHVVPARVVQRRSDSRPLTADFTLSGGATGATRVLLTDGGRGRSLPVLQDLVVPSGSRGDEVLAAIVATGAMRDVFGLPVEATGAPPADVLAFQQPGGGMAIVPYASPDVELSALAAFAHDPTIDRAALHSYLSEVLATEQERGVRTHRIMALAGLAALDEPVLDEIRRLARSDRRDAEQRAWLALGAWGAGDEALAGELMSALLTDEGQRLGSWVRVTAGSREATRLTTATLAIVAAGLGDPLAADMDAFIAQNPPRETLVVLQRALAARAWAERVSGAPAALTLTVDGTARRVDIEPGKPVPLSLTPAQVETASMEPIEGSVIVSTTWDAPLDAASLERAGVRTLERSVTPGGDVADDDLVIVEFTVAFGADADDGCWRVTDFVPSGLAPVGQPWSYGRWYGDEDDVGGEAIAPWNVVGQRVDFCVSPRKGNPTQVLRYAARVVTPGDFAWEPALIQSSIVTERGIVLPARQLVIRSS